MKAEWMGRYRDLVAMLVQHTNIVARSAFEAYEISEGVFLTHVGWQVLEYLMEHEDDVDCMNRVSECLGIPQSSFSKIARQLTDLKLVERYQRSGNRKSIILKPTPLAKKIYDRNSRFLLEQYFFPFFEKLEAVDDASLACVTEALAILNARLSYQEPAPKDELIKLE